MLVIVMLGLFPVSLPGWPLESQAHAKELLFVGSCWLFSLPLRPLLLLAALWSLVLCVLLPLTLYDSNPVLVIFDSELKFLRFCFFELLCGWIDSTFHKCVGNLATCGVGRHCSFRGLLNHVSCMGLLLLLNYTDPWIRATGFQEG